MRKTHTFLEKLAPKSVNGEDESVNWSTLQNPQTDQIEKMSLSIENEQKLSRSRRRKKMRGREEWNREREAETCVGVFSERREKKKSEKEK